MARNKGTFQFAANFEVKLQGALDPRILVDNKSELINRLGRMMAILSTYIMDC